MKILYQSCVVICLLITVIWRPVVSEKLTNKYSETEAAKYLENANHALAQWTNRIVHADWNWLTNLTKENTEKKVISVIIIRCKYFVLTLQCVK